MLKFIFMFNTVHHLDQIVPVFCVQLSVISMWDTSLMPETMLEPEAIAEKPSISFYCKLRDTN